MINNLQLCGIDSHLRCRYHGAEKSLLRSISDHHHNQHAVELVRCISKSKLGFKHVHSLVHPYPTRPLPFHEAELRLAKHAMSD